MIRVMSPIANTFVQNSFTVHGIARGPWYEDGRFDIALYDSNGKLVASTTAIAQGPSEEIDFVPFEAFFMFEQPRTETGKLVLSRGGSSVDNESISVPVRFDPTSRINRIGLLEGQVTLDLACQGGNKKEECKISPEMFSSKKVYIYELDGETLVTEITPDGSGTFSRALPEGDYWVDMVADQYGNVTGVPMLVHINGSSPYLLLITLDTGII